MNKLEDFTEGSEWKSNRGFTLKFHSFDITDGLPLFTCNDDDHGYREFGPSDIQPKGTIGFISTWKQFTRINQS